MMNITIQQAADRLISVLKDVHKIDLNIVTVAESGSIYLEFDDFRMGKVRIGDHDERKRYGYKWQIRTDMDEILIDKQKGHNRFFYPAVRVRGAAHHMSNYLKKIKEKDTPDDGFNSIRVQDHANG